MLDSVEHYCFLGISFIHEDLGWNKSCIIPLAEENLEMRKYKPHELRKPQSCISSRV